MTRTRTTNRADRLLRIARRAENAFRDAEDGLNSLCAAREKDVALIEKYARKYQVCNSRTNDLIQALVRSTRLDTMTVMRMVWA